MSAKKEEGTVFEANIAIDSPIDVYGYIESGYEDTIVIEDIDDVLFLKDNPHFEYEAFFGDVKATYEELGLPFISLDNGNVLYGVVTA